MRDSPRIVGVEAVCDEQRAAGRRLHRGEPIVRVAIVAQEETHPAIAQQTLRIKDHYHAFSSGSNR